jgi:hypothetical protein
MEHAGLDRSASGIATAYAGVLDGLVADERIEGHDLPVLVTDTLMEDAAGRRRLAERALEFAAGLRG